MFKRLFCPFLGLLALRAPAASAGGPSPPPSTQIANHPPELDVPDEERVRAGHDVSIYIRANDPDSDTIRVFVDSVPRGARVRWNEDEQRVTDKNEGSPRYYAPEVVWTPSESDCGVHSIVVTATDGHVSVTKTIRVYVEEQWETFLMPGIAYSAYLPVDRGTYGIFHGPSFELLIAAWIHRSKDHGPSHARIFTGLGLLTSTRSEVSKAAHMNIGFNLSIERNPSRRALIPFFGLESGLLFHSQFGRPGYFTPLVGVHVWSGRNLFVNLTSGYIFPTVGVDQLRGYYGKVAIDFSMW